jgi:excisionase family DNA binding protein
MQCGEVHLGCGERLIAAQASSNMRTRNKMSSSEKDIMTVREVAEYLRLNEMTIYRLARKGEVPALKVGRTWRFKKELIDEWFRQAASTIHDIGSADNEADE